MAMQITHKPSLHASWIDPFAREIVERLQRSGFTTYLVGGCVRDLLVGLEPKDFDIATSALPNEVRRKIPGAYVIGRRFRLVLVKRGVHQYEVATFRRESTPEDLAQAEEGGEDLPSGDNFFGTPEQDALRRDFTVNALFYDPIKDDLLDFANGIEDIKARVVRMIGDPRTRIVEDSIRALRAIRFAHKIRFRLESSLREAIALEAETVGKSLMPRRREEYLKIFRLPEPELAVLEMWDLGLLKVLIPSLHELLENPETRERFLLYLRRWHEMVKDPAQPVEIYTALAWAFSGSLGEMKDIEAKLDQFLRVELGVFKGESMAIDRVFQMQKRLQESEQFQKRGARRQQSFIALPELPLAVRLAQVECMLSPKQASFWNTMLASFGG